MNLLEIVLGFFAQYGYYFLFLTTALENIPVVGVFLPGEVIVVAAGFAASSGTLDLTAVIMVASLGAFTGSCVSYALGYWGGRSLIEAIAGKVGVDGDRIAAADAYFSSHGPVTVFVGRYMSGVKAFIPALAGAHRMRLPLFMIFGAIGIVTWTLGAALLGFYFGRNWETLIGVVKTFGWALPLAVLLIIGGLWYRRRRAAMVREGSGDS